MASMGRRSLTKQSWKTQRCFTSEVQFIDRKAKRCTKRDNAASLRQQAKREIAKSRREEESWESPL